MTEQVYNLAIAPGIQKDGTQFDSGTYVDGKWCRFQRGRPRKMGGYNGIFLNAPGITRGMIQQSRNGENYVYGGYSDSLQYWQTNNDYGIGSGPYNINFIGVLVSVTLTSRGLGYTDGTYNNVALTSLGGSGQGATANFVVLNGIVSTVAVNFGGINYSTIDKLTATLPGGSGVAMDISSVDSFIPSPNNLWQFDISFDATGGNALTLLAHPGQNLTDVDSSVATPVLQGSFPGGDMSKVGRFQVTGTATGNTITIASRNLLIGVGQTVITNISGAIPNGTTVTAVTSVVSPSPLTTVTLSNAVTGSPTVFQFDNNVEVSGGISMLYPYLFVFGSNGLIRNSSAGDFSNWIAADANETNIASTKIIKGLPVRGGTTAPAGLFWSLDSLLRVVYNPTTIGGSAGATIYWTYDIITTQNSIMSSQCVIEYDGLYYWLGTDRLLMYNGVVQENPNVMNMNFFFDNVDYFQRQKVWVSKVPRWGEIWWFYCTDNSPECVNAIVYNVREKIWYDAGFSEGAARSSGVFTEVFHYPIWASTEPNKLGGYTLWQHEFGTDQILLNTVTAIDSYFETNSLGWVSGGPGQRSIQGLNRWIRLERVEPNFVQSGEMTLIVTGKSYADDVAELSDPYVFAPGTPKIDMREQRREMRLKFESNTVGGNYELGNVILSADIGDERGTGNP
jgi:hypothetical protein